MDALVQIKAQLRQFDGQSIMLRGRLSAYASYMEALGVPDLPFDGALPPTPSPRQHVPGDLDSGVDDIAETATVQTVRSGLDRLQAVMSAAESGASSSVEHLRAMVGVPLSTTVAASLWTTRHGEACQTIAEEANESDED